MGWNGNSLLHRTEIDGTWTTRPMRAVTVPQDSQMTVYRMTDPVFSACEQETHRPPTQKTKFFLNPSELSDSDTGIPKAVEVNHV